MISSKRHIKNGSQFNALFPIPKGKTKVVKKVANLDDTLALMRQVVQDTLEDTYALAQYLQSTTEAKTCQNIWNFCYSFIQYEKDETGKEQVRRPSRTWQDRKSGVDCDCFSVLIGSILTNLNIPYSFRLTKYKSNNYEHVYPIAHTKNGTLILDAVVHNFNYEVPYSSKKDITMELEYLNGVDDFIDNDLPIDAQNLLAGEIHDLDGLKKWFKKTKSKVQNTVKKINVKNIKEGAKNALHKVNRFNPVTGLLRAGILASMKLNMMKVSSKLRYAYWSEGQARNNNMPSSKYRQLKHVLQKMEKIFYGAGGKIENLKKAILEGKGNRDRRVVLNGLGAVATNLYDDNNLINVLGQDLYNDEISEVDFGVNGLGAIATGPAIAAATGVIASIAALLKQIGVLFPKGTPQAKMEEQIDQSVDAEEATREFSMQNLVTKYAPSQAVTIAPPILPQGESQNTNLPMNFDTPIVARDENEPNNTDESEEKGIKAWVKKNPVATGGIILGVIGAGFGIAKVVKNSKAAKKKSRSVNGVTTPVLAGPAKKKRTTAKKKKSTTSRKKAKPKRKKKTTGTRAKTIKHIEYLM